MVPAELSWLVPQDHQPYVMAGSSVYTNQQLPEQKVSGKLQAIYQLSS